MLRVGIGYDIHPLEKGRPLVLGGVHIPYSKGLLGYSDADVLFHAVCDAILGAAGLGDIGEHFPDTDPKYKGAASTLFLTEVHARIKELGFRVVNVDCVIIAEAPKLSPFKAEMRANLARALGVGNEEVNIKAATQEGLGAIGKGKAIAVYAVALLER